MNEAFIQLESVNASKTKITAKVKIDCNTHKGVIKKSVTVRSGDDLYKLSNQREIYKDGYIIIDETDVSNGSITLTNGITLSVGESQGGMNGEVMKWNPQTARYDHGTATCGYTPPIGGLPGSCDCPYTTNATSCS